MPDNASSPGASYCDPTKTRWGRVGQMLLQVEADGRPEAQDVQGPVVWESCYLVGGHASTGTTPETCIYKMKGVRGWGLN